MQETTLQPTSTILKFSEKGGVANYDSIADAIGSKSNIWIDLQNPSPELLHQVEHLFSLDRKAIEQYANKSKKPQVRVLENHTFIVTIEISFPDSKTLATEPVYMFVGDKWLITLHRDNISSVRELRRLFGQHDKQVIGLTIQELSSLLLSNTVATYEQLLTSIELTITSLGEDSIHKPSKKMLDRLDVLSKQIIILRRHFWRIRNVINAVLSIKEQKTTDNIQRRYLETAYAEVTQLIELVESLRDSINSTRDLYLANVSLQLNDTVRTLTVFSAILLPLTFISSVYGMNGLDLNNLLTMPIGFVIVLATMGVIATALVIFFTRKNWIVLYRKSKEAD